MTTITDMLAAENVRLELVATEEAQAIREVAGLLRDDSAVLDWEKLHASLRSTMPCVGRVETGVGLCLAHARTDAVTGMVMSVGRTSAGIRFASCPQVIRYVFCIGVPVALDADYLRIVGLLARLLREPSIEEELNTARTPAEFVQTLARLEARL